MKKLLIFLLSLFMAFSLTSCKEPEPYNITLKKDETGIKSTYTMDSIGDTVHTITFTAAKDCSAYIDKQIEIIRASVEQYKNDYSTVNDTTYDAVFQDTSLKETIILDVSNWEPAVSLTKTLETLTSQKWIVTDDVELNIKKPAGEIGIIPNCVGNTLTEDDLLLPDINITLSFTGDMMLAADKNNTRSDNFNAYAQKYPKEYFLNKVRHIFEADDFTTVNLENVFTDRNLKAKNKGNGRAFWFKSATKNVEILTCSSIEGVSLANNHTEDYGVQGYEDTVATVKNAGLEYGIEDKIIYYEKEGFRIAVICHGLWGEWQANEVIHYLDIAKETSDYQIVFYHGGTEGVYKPEAWRMRASRKLVDHGADLIIGNHPHVLQPKEVYNGAEIIYSMGNFCYGGHSQPKNRTIIYQMKLTVDPMTMELTKQESTIIPCYVYTGGGNNNFQPAVIENEDEIQKVLDFMDWKRSTPQ